MLPALLSRPRITLVAFLVSHLRFVYTQTPAPTSTSVSTESSVLTQPIVHPAKKDVLVLGSTFTIEWTANTHFSNITLQLWDKTSWGYSHDLLTPCIPWTRNSFCGTIASHAPNTGSFTWQIPVPPTSTIGPGFPRGEKVFWVKMYVEDYLQESTGNGAPVLSYSQNFMFAKEGESGTTVTGEATATTEEGILGTQTVLVTVKESATIGAHTGAVSTGKAPAEEIPTAIGSGDGEIGGAAPCGRQKSSVLGLAFVFLGLI